MKIPRALTIAGSDSGGGAGIQADIKTFSALGVFGMSAIAALTSQNTVAVNGIVEIDPEFVSSQIRSVVLDIGVDAVKTGMLSNAGIISRVAADLRELKLETVVVDPVMVAKSGDRLLKTEAVTAYKTELFPLALVITPNLHEAEALTGIKVETPDQMRTACRMLKEFGSRYVVLKGGHLPGNPMDLLYDGRDFQEYVTERFDTPHTHGTGCTFASAIASFLARGFPVNEAVGNAKKYITGAIAKGLPLGRGHGPVHHFHEMYTFE
ncbi:MAG: bifunctional hydroxymethylpyrimidine kinase/phosphomethylpyrimidine kinase [Desulfobacteraceae bacterium]|nr:bifunctional hydroxymethylpyrimidine kinase/phosphomethylpyrimidine kinase [Desulfobacteraceae bacterium]